MEYEIRERRYTDHLVHYVVVERIQKIDTGIAHANIETAYDHLLGTLIGSEREILDHAADMKQASENQPGEKEIPDAKYQAYAHAFNIITGVNAYVIHGLVNAILRDRGIKTKPEGPIYTAYLNVNTDGDDEITIVNKHGEMINDFPVLNTSVEALESYGWELVSRVWKNVSDEDNPYGKFKISVRRA
jgi:hypothetical protein